MTIDRRFPLPGHDSHVTPDWSINTEIGTGTRQRGTRPGRWGEGEETGEAGGGGGLRVRLSLHR